MILEHKTKEHSIWTVSAIERGMRLPWAGKFFSQQLFGRSFPLLVCCLYVRAAFKLQFTKTEAFSDSRASETRVPWKLQDVDWVRLHELKVLQVQN